MKYDGKTIIAKADANTEDIIQALINITPKGIDQVKDFIKKFNLTGDALKDAYIIGTYIRSNVKYKSDGYADQNIVTPARMFKDLKQADCKSFSLAFLSLMNAAGYKTGYRFASYRKNKIPTHVYNWFIGNDKNFYTFDTCVKNFKESPRHTFIKDMQVNYLTGFDNDPVNGPFKNLRKRITTAVKKVATAGKQIALSVPRQAFRGLVALNVRGIAQRLNKGLEKNPDKVYQLWEKFGGDKKALKQSIDTGKNKKALLGKGKGVNGVEFDYISEYEFEYMGEPVTAAALIASASAILIPMKNLLDGLGIKEEAGEPIITADEAQFAAETGNKITDPNFTVTDPEIKSGATGKSGMMNFKPSPLLIGGLVGAAALVYFLTKKKR